jgi:hypothetical protein
MIQYNNFGTVYSCKNIFLGRCKYIASMCILLLWVSKMKIYLFSSSDPENGTKRRASQLKKVRPLKQFGFKC